MCSEVATKVAATMDVNKFYNISGFSFKVPTPGYALGCATIPFDMIFRDDVKIEEELAAEGSSSDSEPAADSDLDTVTEGRAAAVQRT